VQAFPGFKSLPLRQIRIRINRIHCSPRAGFSMGYCRLTANLTAKFVKQVSASWPSGSTRARRKLQPGGTNSVDLVGISLSAASLAATTVVFVGVARAGIKRVRNRPTRRRKPRANSSLLSHRREDIGDEGDGPERHIPMGRNYAFCVTS